MSSRAPTAPPPVIEGLTWVRVLGSGGFADVHLYRQDLPSRDVAVKVTRDPGERAGVEQLRREADAAAAVSGHPAVIELHGAGTSQDGRPYLIMEYCPVTDIGEQARARPMPVEKVLDLVIQVCGGVETLHRAGLVHRDIKPSNIMLDAYGRPVLADFGVAAPIGRLEAGRMDGLSVLWAPPEQQDARTHAHPTQDVWALAATTWTLLTGRSPFEDPLGDNDGLAIAKRVRSGVLHGLGRPDAPIQLEAVLRAAMALDPAERTASALRLGESLQNVQRVMGRPLTSMRVGPDRPDLAAGASSVPALDGGTGDGASVPTRRRSRPARAELTRHRAASFEFDDEVPEVASDAWVDPSALNTDSTGRSLELTGGGQRRLHPLSAVALVAGGVVATAALVVAMLTGGGRTTTPAPAGHDDPVGADTAEAVDVPPLPVESLAGQVDGEEIAWSWVDGVESATVAGAGTQSHPAAEYYTYTVERPGHDPHTDRADLNSVRVSASPGENCIEVTAVAAGGRASDPVRQCIEVP